MANNKGDRRERELVNLFDDDGFAVMRAPASGGGTDRELPDILVGDGNLFYSIEAKSSSGQPIYVKQKEIEDLNYFSSKFGCEPRIAVRFDREDWYFFDPDDCYRTDSGNYRIKKGTAIEDGISYHELVEQNIQN